MPKASLSLQSLPPDATAALVRLGEHLALLEHASLTLGALVGICMASARPVPLASACTRCRWPRCAV